MYAAKGNFEAAEPLLKTALAGREKMGGDHYHTLETLNELGGLYTKVGQFDEAEPLLVRTLEARTRTLGDHHASTQRSRRTLGAMYADMGNADSVTPASTANGGAVKRLRSRSKAGLQRLRVQEARALQDEHAPQRAGGELGRRIQRGGSSLRPITF